jgi:hypothetical protein
MSTMTANRQPPRIAVEIARLVLKAFAESHKTADRESLDSDTRPAADDARPQGRDTATRITR